DQDAKYALSKLLQMGTVEDYQREFEMLIKRVTIPEYLLSRFISPDLNWIYNVYSLEFFKACITEARFEIIAKEEKEHIVENKIDVILPLQGEFASPKAKGSLNADEYIGVEEVVAGGKALRIGEDDDLGDSVTNAGKDWQGDVHVLIDNGSTHNFIRTDVVKKLCLPTHFTKVFKVYIGRGETLLCENMCAHVAIEIQCLRKKVDLYMLLMKGIFRRQQQQIATNAKIQRRLWDPEINIYFRHHLEDKVVVKEWGMIRPRFE
nr:RVP_2 domain-containing protein [Tanacetum cinerariifolium]